MKILIRKDGRVFKEIEFLEEEYTIGRSKEADIQLLNDDVSRKHVKISRRNNKIVIEDLKSKNGTVYRNQLIYKAEIEPGQIFIVGPFEVTVEGVRHSEQKTVAEHTITEMETREFRIDRNRAGTPIHTQHSITIIEPKDEIARKAPPRKEPVIPTPKKPEPKTAERPMVEDASDPSISVSLNEAFAEEVDEIPDDPNTQHSVVAPPPKPPSFKDKQKEKNIKTELHQPVKDDYDDFMSAISVDREKSISAKAPKEEIEENSDSISDVEFASDSFTDIDEPKTVPLEEKEQEKKTRNTKPINPFEQDELEDDDVDNEKSNQSIQQDFPSASDDDSVSEQFFLNREIDEGVGETFEDFPKTNKIRLMDHNLSDQVEGHVEAELIDTDPASIDAEKTAFEFEEGEDSHSGSDAVMTESFKEGQTGVGSPDEDEIKTFAFSEDDLPPTKVGAFEVSRHKVVGTLKNIARQVPAYTPKVVDFVKKPKNRRFVFVTMAVVFGLGLYFMFEGDTFSKREPVNPDVAIKSEAGFNKLRKSEKKRVIAYQIDKIQKLINDRELVEADEKMRMLVTLASNDEEFVKFEKKYQQQRELLIEEENKKQKEKQDKEKNKSKLMADGDAALNKKLFAQAKRNYMKVLEMFPDDANAQEKIQTLELLQEQEDRKAFAKKQRYDMLDRIYTEAVQKYESGQPGVAQKLFSQVTAEKSHPRYKKAVEYLGKIENTTDKKVDDRIAKARDMIQKPATLLQGYNELKKITAQFPLRADAKKYLSDGKTKMEKKARELYADALAQEELAGDPAAALDLYKEVLKYAPDTSNKYYIKAKQKIDNLQL